MKDNITIPMESGRATVSFDENSDNFSIEIIQNGRNYRFISTPVGIESFSVDGNVEKKYEK